MKASSAAFAVLVLVCRALCCSAAAGPRIGSRARIDSIGEGSNLYRVCTVGAGCPTPASWAARARFWVVQPLHTLP